MIGRVCHDKHLTYLLVSRFSFLIPNLYSQVGFPPFAVDDMIAVYEMKRRNSGFMEGKFAEKTKKRNPETGNWYDLNDLWVGNVITVASMPFRLLRPDEYSLAYMENHPEEYAYFLLFFT